MKDICSKCKLKELCNELPDDLSCDDVKKIAEVDKSEPPKEEKWIEEDIDFDTFWKCSECGFNGAMIPDNFCPNCGADMRGET